MEEIIRNSEVLKDDIVTEEKKKRECEDEIMKLKVIFENIEQDVTVENREEIENTKDEVKIVVEFRKQVGSKIQKLSADLAKMKNQKWMVLEEIDSWMREQGELFFEKEELEMRLSSLNGYHNDCSLALSRQQELEILKVSIETEIELKKKEHYDLSKETEQVIEQMKKREADHRTFKNRITAGLKIRDEKMKKLKRELDIILQTFSNACRLEGVPHEPVDSRLREVVGHIGRGIEVDILREQIKSVKQEEEELRKSLHKRSQSLRDTLERTGEIKSQELENRVSKFTQQHEQKCQALAEWSDNLQSLLQANTGSGDFRTTYSLFLEGRLEHQLQRDLSRRINWSETYQKKLDQMVKLLETYSEAAGEKGKEFLEEKKSMEAVELEQMELGSRKELCNWLINQVQSEIKELQSQKMQIEQDITEVRASLESIVSIEVESRFKDIEKANSDHYKWLHRTYGIKVYLD